MRSFAQDEKRLKDKRLEKSYDKFIDACSMALRSKKIETVNVDLQGSIDFCRLLNRIVDISYDADSGKIISLHKHEENDEYFSGYVNVTKQIGIPPKHNSIEDTFEALPINEGEGEGLGFSNVFVYDKRSCVLMYEFNKNGCYLTSFRRCILYLYNDIEPEGQLDISFYPLLRPEAYERMLNIDIYKTLEVKIATPREEIRDFLDENDALVSAITTSQELGADTMSLKFDIKGRPVRGMSSQFISRLVRNVRRLFERDESSVRKLVIRGYYHDPEQDVDVQDTIDFILDRYKKNFSVDEPNVLSDPQTNEKLGSLLGVYLDCRGDFRIFAQDREY